MEIETIIEMLCKQKLDLMCQIRGGQLLRHYFYLADHIAVKTATFKLKKRLWRAGYGPRAVCCPFLC